MNLYLQQIPARRPFLKTNILDFMNLFAEIFCVMASESHGGIAEVDNAVNHKQKKDLGFSETNF